ncbi:hypothetical protein METBIDRAFT_11439 [Metschnikowia bicuspidata var. bicuspidata NRRL YB-4993]|uniref:Uncharacterized protein n=1 Tax=Metschnikowia bicuspidata var. bicuspidata NRRL YB-4993 TaxID=869754 RepID=A0A1A0HF48_9ASCO|nr:hypothetical protein METBIDRAFT_11439 [Metschnikowia bicuspidata var. bicuspidata NRRL YB-4993]OBA22626.1 hypothetical protein METBIDRAFT_11439 [Metschnikowia bicuspidata var. bicuspidata NRRL YB-4993]
MDIKKSYEYWQELVSKNMKLRLKPRRASDAGGGAEISNDQLRERVPPYREPTLRDLMTSEELELFSKPELQSFRQKVSEKLALQRGLQLKDSDVDKLLESCLADLQFSQGFDPYGNEDEVGLHDGNSCTQDLALNTYEGPGESDEDVLADDYHMMGPSRHRHFEVELSDGPPGIEPDPNEPSCEFTFEYDRDGKLIPTSNNIEEKLRLMNLQSQITNEALSQALALAMAMAAGGKKKKKHNKKKKKAKGEEDHGTCVETRSDLCLFCQYETFYGVKPLYSMRKLDYTHKWEMERRMKFREKLGAAKLYKAKHEHSRDDAVLVDDLEDSHGTVEDE